MVAHIPDKKSHSKALVNALNNIRLSLEEVFGVLDGDVAERNSNWKTSTATVLLGGVLDGLIILEMENVDEIKPNAMISFHKCKFKDLHLQSMQDEVLALVSQCRNEQAKCLGFNSLMNLWKHYYPYPPVATDFDRNGVKNDFSLPLGDDLSSAPVMSDLVLPAFNAACGIMRFLSNKLGQTCDLEDLAKRAVPYDTMQLYEKECVNRKYNPRPVAM